MLIIIIIIITLIVFLYWKYWEMRYNTPMKLSLSISERLFCLTVLNAFKGNLEKLSVILEDIKKFPIIEEEWKNAEKKETKMPDGTIQWNWNDEKGGEKEIEISVATADYLKGEIKRKDDAGEFTLADKNIISLKEKLK